MTIATIRKRLLQAEESFLTASNESLMGDFEHAWNTLALDIKKAISANQMTQEDMALVDAVSSRITSLCKTFVEFTNAYDDINLSFEQDLERILEEHTQENHHTRSRSSEEILHPTSAPYIKQAYSWLMQNLSNPYPSKEVREIIAREAGSDPKHVENWFGDARKRMGWNAIRRRHFSNKRRSTVAAATAFFGGQSSKLLTDLMRQDFAAMLADAKDMYSKKFIESRLARHIDGVTGFSRESRSQSASVESAASLSPRHSIFHALLPQTQSRSRKRPRPLDSTDDVLGTSKSKKRPRHCYSDDRSPVSLHSSLQDAPPPSSSPVPLNVPAAFRKKRQASGSEDHWSPRHPSKDCGTISLQSVSDTIRNSCDPSSSSSTLSPDVSDEPITSQYTINEATKRADHVNIAYSQQPPTVHPSAPCLSHDIQQPSLSSRKENNQLSTELQAPVPCDNSAAMQGFGLVLPTSDVTHDNLFSGSTVDERFLAISSSDFASRTLSSVQDTNITSWATTIVNAQTDGQYFGYFDCLPIDSTFAAQVDALPALADVDLTFGNLFDLDASSTFPPSDPHLDSLFPLDGGLTANDLLTLTPAVENSMVKLAQLEQLKKRRNRLQEHINSLELQIAGTLVA